MPKKKNVFIFDYQYLQANWFKASQYCRYHGMHLASVSSQEENDKLENHIKEYGELNLFVLLFNIIIGISSKFYS